MKKKTFKINIIILLLIITTGLIINNNNFNKNNITPAQTRNEKGTEEIHSGLISKNNLQDLKANESMKKTNTMDSKRKSTYSIQKKVVYLTFDDGPNNIITNGVIDVLNKYNVKGTFFIVGKEINRREKTMKRICNEGFGIGLHSYTHNLKHIYKNPDIFIKEMKDTNKHLYNITGCSTKIIRFPGGSSGRLDRAFIDKLHSHGFKIYDWTNSAEDGLHPE